MNSPRLEYTTELLRHFADLRDGSHGGAISRKEKERLFTAAVALLDPYARQPLEEMGAPAARLSAGLAAASQLL
jgi:hypothetical protein